MEGRNCFIWRRNQKEKKEEEEEEESIKQTQNINLLMGIDLSPTARQSGLQLLDCRASEKKGHLEVI